MEKQYTVYIIRSKSIDRFYIGYTSLSMDERLSYHNYKNKGYTGKANDWKVVWVIEYESKSKAMTEEKKIKKRGASRYLTDQE